jgi:penicillin-binding protein 1A
MLKNNGRFDLSYNRPNKKTRLSFFVILKYFLLFTFIAVFAAGGIAIGGVYGIIKDTSFDNSLFTDVKINSTVYDSYKEEVTTLRDSDINREWATLEEIPENLQLAFIAIEDKRFYEHDGVDYQGLIAAVFSKITHPSQQMRGASTLTMQLIKNLTQDDARAIERKVSEQYIAMELEKILTEEKGSKTEAKKVILEKYLNQINLGGNMNGVKIAAKYYFNKELGEDELTLAECACLASITKSPASYAPDPTGENTENNENNKNRRNDVLNVMLEENFIDESSYNEAIKEEIAYEEGSIGGGSSQTYFVDAVITQLQEDLVEGMGMNECSRS